MRGGHLRVLRRDRGALAQRVHGLPMRILTSMLLPMNKQIPIVRTCTKNDYDEHVLDGLLARLLEGGAVTGLLGTVVFCVFFLCFLFMC